MCELSGRAPLIFTGVRIDKAGCQDDIDKARQDYISSAAAHRGIEMARISESHLFGHPPVRLFPRFERE
jgi:hypothetical protein